MRVILQALKFVRITVHPPPNGYLQAMRQLADMLLRQDEDCLFFVNPPLSTVSKDGKSRVSKDLGDFFSGVKLLISRSKKDPIETISKCVPVFTQMQMPQRREQSLLQLAGFGICGAFIFKPQEPLGQISPQLKRLRLEEYLKERLWEVKEYLTELLPHMDGAVAELMEKQEEAELSKRKHEADSWMRKGRQARVKKDYEYAVQCFSKAIDIYPADPYAYLESGKVFVRMKRYPKALLRFSQAEDVADNIPEPNKEIGDVRILQVRERLDMGESPNSAAVKILLDDAMKNYEAALKKAAAIKPLLPGESRQRNVEAVTRLAGALVKMNLKNLLGKTHPAVKRLGSLAREAFQDVAKTDMTNMPADQLIFLGLAALDEQKWDEAEDYLFRAAQDKEHFTDACNEITYMGTVTRRQRGSDEAIRIYQKLLELSPPNSAAVNYNLAVAQAISKNELESADAIVQAVYTDPTLPENAVFYNNLVLLEVLGKVLRVLDTVAAKADKVQTPPLVLKTVDLQERLEGMVMAGNAKAAFRLLWHVYEVMPDFFYREQIYASKAIINFIKDRLKALQNTQKPELQRCKAFLEDVLKERKKSKYSKRLLAYTSFKHQTLQALTETEDRAVAAGRLVKALVCHPAYLEEPEFFANHTLVSLALEARAKLGSVNRQKIQG